MMDIDAIHETTATTLTRGLRDSETPGTAGSQATAKETERPIATKVLETSAPDGDEVSRLAKQLENIQRRGYLRELKLDYHVEEGGEIFLRILDARTNEVIRTVPSEAQREFARRLNETLGLIFDEQV